MAELVKRQTDIRTSKGQTTSQQYAGRTEKTVTTTVPGFTENRTTQPVVTDTSRTSGTIEEVRTTNGVGKSSQSQEDYGVVLRFKIPFQGKQPIVRQTP